MCTYSYLLYNGNDPATGSYVLKMTIYVFGPDSDSKIIYIFVKTSDIITAGNKNTST